MVSVIGVPSNMANSNEKINTSLIQSVLIEELKARYSEIDMLNKQIGSIYNLSISTIGVVAAVIGLSSRGQGGESVELLLNNDISRIASAAVSCVFITLLILKNQYNSRIARQATYINSVIRPKLTALCGLKKPYFLEYESFAKNNREEFFKRNKILKYLTYENIVIGLPFFLTIFFSIAGSVHESSRIESIFYIVILMFGVYVWMSTGGFFSILEKTIESSSFESAKEKRVEKILLKLRKYSAFRSIVSALNINIPYRIKEIKSKIYIQMSRSTEELFGRSYDVEREVIQIVQEIISKNSYKTFIDIGSNIGVYAWIVEDFSKDIKIYCVEPDLYNVITLSKTAILRNSGVCIIRAAVSDSNSNGVFLSDDVTGKTGSLVTVYGNKSFSENFFNQKRRSQSVSLITLDSMYDLIDEKTLIKIDIEGGELSLLKGASRVMHDKKPTIILEINRNYKEEVFRILDSYGYNFSPISKEGFLDRDYLVTPKDS